ncbi:putative oligonucleotidase [Helianthus annuus]|nr:putative oligonucleotidase [Helianthus annuus]KAJ0723029.1 putative oligonucleotidase [Helianthus annuus]KAJ0898680.1 putative oligonucleotidase [Helianthus annuus]
MSRTYYKLPLVWIKLQKTGLNVEVDRILEIACVITDGKLRKLVEGPDLVIHQTKDCVDEVGEQSQDHHVIDFVKGHVNAYMPSLAGNSVYVDFMFLKKYMPDLASLFSHVLVDISSIKALCCHWFPEDDKKAPKKEKKHGAVLDEIKESITELKYYKEHAFRSPKSKR